MAVGTGPRIALLVDAENVPAACLDAVVTHLSARGSLTAKQAYGNWQGTHLRPWAPVLKRHGVAERQQGRHTKGKNVSDMALVIGAMDLLHAGSTDAFAIVSSDADFTPLVNRLKQDGKTVLGFGEKKTPQPLVQACSAFFRIQGSVVTAARVPAPRRASADVLLGDTALVNNLLRAVESGWVPLSTVGQRLDDEGTDWRRHGYGKLSALVAATQLFEVKRRRLHVSVRARQPVKP